MNVSNSHGNVDEQTAVVNGDGDPSKKRAYLLSHGSFNPVHRHHVEMMVLARKRLEDAGYSVVAGVLAPTCREHISWKGIPAMGDEFRLVALRMACSTAGRPLGWLRCDPRGVNYGSVHKMMKQLLDAEFSAEFPGVVGFEVKGADVVARYGTYDYDMWYPCVIVGRAGDTDIVRDGLARAGFCNDTAQSLFFIEAELAGVLSSTKLREALARDMEDEVYKMCPKTVAEYLYAHRLALFEDDPPCDLLRPRLSVCNEIAVVPDKAQEVKDGRTSPKRSATNCEDSTPRKCARSMSTFWKVPCAVPVSKTIDVYFVRHGEARHNIIDSAWTELDPCLTPKGESQAAALHGHTLLKGLRRPLLVAVSPLWRCLQTSVLGCGGGATFVANSDLQEPTPFPCDTGRPSSALAAAFPSVDFTGLDGDAWRHWEPPRHHDKWARLERFALWCAACPQDQLVVVSHQHVCRMLLGVVLDNCDVVGMTLDRESCRWAPLAYEDWRKVTLQSTCAKGSREGLRALLAAKDRGRMINEDVGGGWPMLHHAAENGNADAVRELLQAGSDPSRRDSDNFTAGDWAAHRKRHWVLSVLRECGHPVPDAAVQASKQ